jgi:hypothetical protein
MCQYALQMGEVVNYMQLDTARLEHVVHSIHTTWDGALQVFSCDNVHCT